MPPSSVVLNAAAAIADDWRVVAIAWHAVLAAGALLLLLGWRPSYRCAGLLLAVPLVSVSAAARASGNPFNTIVFAVLALGLALMAARLPSNQSVAPPRAGVAAAGVAAVLFGVAYPHFLRTDSWSTFIYAAPFGVLPCPTLAAVVGLAMLAGLYRFRRWSGLLIVAAGVYGGIGVFRLDVVLDYGLIASTVALAAAVYPPGGRLAAGPRQAALSHTIL